MADPVIFTKGSVCCSKALLTYHGCGGLRVSPKNAEMATTNTNAESPIRYSSAVCPSFQLSLPSKAERELTPRGGA